MMKRITMFFWVLTLLLSGCRASIPLAGLPFGGNGLVAYYPFDGNTKDVSGHENHGEAKDITLVQDRFGKDHNALSLDGVNDFLVVPYSKSLDLTESLSISVWAQGGACSSCGGSLSGIVGKGPLVPYGLAIDDGDRVLFRVVSAGTFHNALKTEAHINPSKWNHFVGVFKAGKYIKIYINGNEAVNVTADVPRSIDHSEEELWIGSRAHSHDEQMAPLFYFEGAIDEVRIYSRALEPEEVQDLFSKGSGAV
jgi:hypothetical protein